MPNPIALTWLRTHGNQQKLRRFVEQVTGRSMAQSTASRWANEDRRPDACAEALIAVLADPALLDKLNT